jgi:hypothetical protein
MSEINNDILVDKLAELIELITFLKTELDACFDQGRFDDADQVAVELYDTRKQANRLAGMLDINLDAVV